MVQHEDGGGQLDHGQHQDRGRQLDDADIIVTAVACMIACTRLCSQTSLPRLLRRGRHRTV